MADLSEDGIIKAVPTESVRRICTGQVILSLSGACKELIENALDANATCIDIFVKNFGADTVEVTDDGCGIRESEFEALCLPHQTSKIRSFDDLQRISSYGFRGEALNALCALSTLSVSTRNPSSPVGFNLKFDRMGKLIDKKPCSRQIGTTVTLGVLFDPLPVRRKELMANVRREYTKLVSIVHAYALICTHVRIDCHAAMPDKKHTIVQTQANENLSDRICQVLGAKQLETLVPLSIVPVSQELCEEYGLTQQQIQAVDLKLEGFVSSCVHSRGRSSTDRQYISVNKRPCDYQKVTKTINDVYHQFNRAQYPVIILDIGLPKISVDVNVSPDKRSLFISQQKVLLVLIRAAVLDCFTSLASECPSLNPRQPHPSVCRDSEGLEPPLKQAKLQFQRLSQPSTPNTPPHISPSPCNTTTPTPPHRTPLNQKKTDNNSLEQIIENIDLEVEAPDVQKSSEISEMTDFISASAVMIENRTPSKAGAPVTTSDDYQSTSSLIMHTPTPISNTSIDTPPHIPTSSNLANQNQTGIDTVGKVLTQTVNNGDHSWRSSKTISFSMQDLISSRKKINRNGEDEVDQGQTLFNAKIAPAENETAELELKRLIKKTDFSRMKIIGQFNLGFIICLLDQDLFIIDQHASDEKATFEALHKSAVIHSQKLIIPQSLDITPLSESVINDNMDIFNKNGFFFQQNTSGNAGDRLKLSALPILHNLTFDRHDIDEIAAVLADFPGIMYRPSRIRKIFASKACRKAVMIGTALNKATMHKIVTQLAELQDPWSCPHGRPTMRHLFCLKPLVV